MYDTVDELLAEILAGEDSFLDLREVVFKGKQTQFAAKNSRWGNKAQTELANDLCCFANTEGGVIVFGVRDDRERVGIIEISNPGKLHNTLTLQDLFAGCQPVRRNQMLSGFLRVYISPITQRAYMEGRGEGFLTMVRECKKVSNRLPQLEIIGDSVKLTIRSAVYRK